MVSINPLNHLGRTVHRTVTSGRPSLGALGGIFSLLKLAALGVAGLSLFSPETLQQHLPDWRGGTGMALLAVAGLALLSSVFRTLRGTFGAFLWLAVLVVMGKAIFVGNSSGLSLPGNPISPQRMSGLVDKLNPFGKGTSPKVPSLKSLGVSEQLKDPELKQVVKSLENSWLGEDADMKFDSLNDKGGEFVELTTTKRSVRQIIPNAPAHNQAPRGLGSPVYRMRGDELQRGGTHQGQPSSGGSSSLSGELVELFSGKTKALINGKPVKEHDLTYSNQSVFASQSGIGGTNLSDGTIVGRGDDIYFAKPSTAKLGSSIEDGGDNIPSRISRFLGR